MDLNPFVLFEYEHWFHGVPNEIISVSESQSWKGTNWLIGSHIENG